MPVPVDGLRIYVEAVKRIDEIPNLDHVIQGSPHLAHLILPGTQANLLQNQKPNFANTPL